MDAWFLLPCLTAAAPAPPSHLAGTYVLESGPDLPALFAAARASLKPAERAHARERLEQNNPVHRVFTLRVDARHFTLSLCRELGLCPGGWDSERIVRSGSERPSKTINAGALGKEYGIPFRAVDPRVFIPSAPAKPQRLCVWSF